MAAISPGYINPQGQNHNFKLPEDNMDKLFFKLPGRDGHDVCAGEAASSDDAGYAGDYSWGDEIQSFGLRCSDPTVYKAALRTHTLDTSGDGVDMINLTGETYTYPMVWLQHTTIHVDQSASPPVDRAAIRVRNYGSYDPLLRIRRGLIIGIMISCCQS